jgi:hypothetical protein
MPKFESSIKVSTLESLTGNTALLHLGPDNRVGIGTTKPETKLHVDGAITASGLIVKAGSLATQGDAAEVLGFTPNMDDWYVNADGKSVVNGWTQTTGGGSATESSDRQLGLASAEFDNAEVVWQREVVFDSPLYANVFLQGTLSYKFDSWSSGTPGIAVTVTHREKANSDYNSITNGVVDWKSAISNTFIVPVSGQSREPLGLGKWTSGAFRAHTPGNREITKLKFEIISHGDIYYNTAINDGGSGNATSLGGGTNYNWNLDGFNFSFMHPDMRVDQLGRITGAFIEAATIDDLHIKDMISSTSSLIDDRPAGQIPELDTLIPEGHEQRPEDGKATGLAVQGLVANDVYASGWSISKSGKVKATDLEIYGQSGTVLISGDGQIDGRDNPFAKWFDRRLSDFDPDASSYLYGLDFTKINETDLYANNRMLLTDGLSSDAIVANTVSVFIANTGTINDVDGSLGSHYSNGSIFFNGITSNAPPGSIVIGTEKPFMHNRKGYILFLANTQKWDSNEGVYQKYHANSYLGEYGLYVYGEQTFGGWIYHPHGNSSLYSISETVPTDDSLQQNDFLVVGAMGIDGSGQVDSATTRVETPRHPDSIVNPDRNISSPIGITGGGILFADIHVNQWNHSANVGEVQFVNKTNNPNTTFTFIHPGGVGDGDSVVYRCNGAYGVLTSLEDFPGSRYITFVGADRSESQKATASPDSRFTLQTGHSPDFVAAFPIGTRWFYNQDEGKYSEFTPTERDCIVARVDSDGTSYAGGDGSSKITNIYRYAERAARTQDGSFIDDMIINPPQGMAHGGAVFADFRKNEDYVETSGTYVSNNGIIAMTNSENDPKNRFFVIHPESTYTWEVDQVGRGVVTNNASIGTRHIAFVGGDNRSLPGHVDRFPMADGLEHYANDFIAVLKYDDQGNSAPFVDGVQSWWYDNGQNTSTYFTPIANDFVVATAVSFDDTSNGIEQLYIWSAREARMSDGTTLTSIKNALDVAIDAANNVANSALSRAQDALDLAGNALSNAYVSLGLLDGEIALYFQEEGTTLEGGTGGEFNEGSYHIDFDYGDLWINTIQTNRNIDGSWDTNAIFRYANSSRGWEDTSDAGTRIAWRRDANSALGRAALKTLENRDFTDRATVVHYAGRSAEYAPFFGPNVAVISSGSDKDATIPNNNPEGDLWYDTRAAPGGAGPSNHAYVYRTNTSFSNSTHYKHSSESGYTAGKKGYISTGKGAWAQTTHNSATSGPWEPATAQTGWWSLQDPASGDIQALVDAEAAAREAQDNVLDALIDDAQAAADREILAFFEEETYTPNATGNGDVWIHTNTITKTDGTLNTGAIFVANTKTGGPYNDGDHRWWAAPNNAIGLMYAKAYTSGVSGEFQRGTNIMPRGYSLWDAPLSDYFPATSDHMEDPPPNGHSIANPEEVVEPYPLFYWNYSAILQQEFSNVAIDHTGNAYAGTKSLRLTTRKEVTHHNAMDEYLVLGRGLPIGGEPAAENLRKDWIQIPKGKRWIFSYYIKANTTIETSTMPRFALANDTHAWAGSKTGTEVDIAVSGAWQRHSAVIDLSSSDESDGAYASGWTLTASRKSPKNQITGITPILTVNSSSTQGIDYYIDAIQLEEVPNTVFTASQFKEPSDGKSIVFGREITDGKIVTHFGPHYGTSSQWYGPIPNTTPSGLPNPEPHGDFWVNTSNNNIIFRYHQQDLNSIPSSQTVYWTSEVNGSGWYTTEDIRTGNALTTAYDAIANAASARAAADREIIAYFQTTAPGGPSGNGDIWIDTDSFATLNSSSIYVNRQQDGAYWEQSSESAIGRAYLQGWLAGEQADRGEALAIAASGGKAFEFPIAPTVNGIVGVGATGNVVFYKNSENEYLVDQAGSRGEIFVTNRGGIDFVGPNGSIWYSQAATYPQSNYGMPETGAIYTPYGGTTGTPTDGQVVANGYLMYTNMNAAARFSTSKEAFGTHRHIIPVLWNEDDNTWHAVDNSNTKYPFAPNAANGDFIVAKITRPTTVPEGLATLQDWVFDVLPTQLKGFIDGKIVTHYETHYATSGVDKGKYGPIPNTTPTGIHNPEPHGDLWVDTSNNNLIFRYHQNSFSNYAQTVFHAPMVPANTMAGTHSHDAAIYDSSEPWSGWYSTEDLRIKTGVDAFSLAETARQQAVTSQAAADREILVFFNSREDDTPTSTGNGDIWIVTDYATKPGTKIANTTSIRVANTKGGDAYFGAGGSRYWHVSPNNAIGLGYLENYVSTNNVLGIADGKVVTFYGPEYYDNPYYYGPMPNTTPSGLDNPTPHGDFWINTSNNNLEFIYNQNNASITTDPDRAYAQTIFWNPGAGFEFDKTSNPSGWYGTEDDRTANALSRAVTANTNAGAAQLTADQAREDAVTSQAAADREILSFFRATTDSSGVPISTGNGDIWIQTDSPVNTDGTPNTSAIYIANTKSGISYFDAGASPGTIDRHWHPAPNNAIGLSYLQSYASGISGSYQRGDNIMPRGYSMFNEPLKDYVRRIEKTADQAPSFIEPYPIATYDSNRTVNVAIDKTGGANAYIGDSSLRIERYSTGLEEDFIGFYGGIELTEAQATENQKYRIDIPAGKKWIFSYFMKANTAGATTRPDFWTSNTTFNRGTSVNRNLYTGSSIGTDWSRHHFVLDLTTSDYVSTADYGRKNKVTSITPLIYITPSRNTPGTEYFIDGIQLEEATGDVPSVFREPSEYGSNIFGRQIIDGKIVTRYESHYPEGGSAPWYGPQPHITPTGSHNPEPHGDAWFNTSNNNILFRYHQNSINYTAQTIFFPALGDTIPAEDPSGWYCVEDARVLAANQTAYQALANAATAQAAADREINTFFQIHSSIPTATGNGDIWIQTDNAIELDGSANIYSIFRSKSAGSTLVNWYQSETNGIGRALLDELVGEVGNNWMPRGWSMFDAPATDYANTSPENNTVPYKFPTRSIPVDIVDDQNPPVGTKALSLRDSGGTSYTFLGANSQPEESASNWTYDQKLVEFPYGKRWILSWYAKNPDGPVVGPKNSGVWLYFGNNSVTGDYENRTATGHSWLDYQTFTSSDWERHWIVFDLTGGSDGTGTVADINLYTGSGNADSADKANSFNQFLLRIDPGGWKGSGWTEEESLTYYTGFQLEEVRNSNRITPSVFQEPSTSTWNDFSRAIADGKIVTHYENNDGGLGPQPQYTPQGEWNPTPYGDLWVDTANNNIVFRYYQNTTNYESRTSFHQTGASAVQPSAHDDQSGWYSTEDLRAQTAWTATDDLKVEVDRALSDAAAAASAGDAEILAFFEVSTNTSMYAPVNGSKSGPATGNGDIWIHTDQVYDADGNQNTGAIFFANLSPSAPSNWTQSPNHAIGRNFLELFTSTSVKNWFPSGYSTWDEPEGSYLIGDSNDDFNADTPYQLTTGYPSGVYVNNSFGKVTSDSLQVTSRPSGSDPTSVYFANGSARDESVGYGYIEKLNYEQERTIAIPEGKRWIYSFYAYSNSSAATMPQLEHYLFFNDNNSITSNLVVAGANTEFTVRNQWERFSYVLDFSNTHTHANASTFDSDKQWWFKFTSGETDGADNTRRNNVTFGGDPTSSHPRLANLNSMWVILRSPVGNTIWYDGFQLEEAPGAQILSSPFSDPDQSRSLDFTRAISDGKIVTHYEPSSSDLVGWWRMDGANSATYETDQAQGITNVVNPGVLDAVWTTGSSDGNNFVNDTIFGAGKSADVGDSSGIALVPHEEMADKNQITFTLWYKPLGEETASTVSARIISRDLSDYWALYRQVAFSSQAQNGIDTTGLAFGHAGQASNPTITNGLKYGIWNFLAITVDYTAKEHRVYSFNEIDGFVGEASGSFSSSSASPDIGVERQVKLAENVEGEKFGGPHSGVGSVGPGNNGLPGRYDQVRFYKKVLSKYDVDALFNTRTRSRKTPSLLLYPEWYNTSNNPVYGPKPDTTPSGLPNHVPHGDFWIDTSSSNRAFVYNQNTVNKTAQTAYYSTIAYQKDLLGYEPSGWFDVSDGTTEIVADDIEDAFRGIAVNLDEIKKASAIADHEIVVFFNSEGEDSGKFANANHEHIYGMFGGDTTTAPGYGDIWINTSGYNVNALSGGLSSNAIFRWQNATGLSTNSLAIEAGTGKSVGLAWRHAENDGIGQVYLTAYAAQNVADSKTTIYFESGSGDPYKGPDPYRTPKGRVNLDPDGDMWVDTGNNNVKFIYNRTSPIGDFGADHFDNAVHRGGTMSSEGWYHMENLLHESTARAIELAAATGTDRHAQIFYSITAPATSTGNGDIWIDTTATFNADGTANTLSIYVANATATDYGAADSGPTRYWNLGTDSALGRSALDGYNADQKSARSELMSLIVTGDSTLETSVPFPVYPAANGIMGIGATGNVAFFANKLAALYDPSAPAGENQPPIYDPIYHQDNHGEILVLNEGGVDFIGPDGIKRDIYTTAKQLNTRFESNFIATGSGISNTHYIMYTKTVDSDRFPPAAGATGDEDDQFSTADHFVHVIWNPDTESWYVLANFASPVNLPGEYPFVPDADEGDFLVARLYKDTAHHSSFRVERWIFDSLPQQTRKYSDGKTVYFVSNAFHTTTSKDDHMWGPDPSTTPNGLINLEPYGDKWISESPPYKTYLYFSNNTNKTSQTAFHAGVGPLAIAQYANTMWPYSAANNNSGWYEYRDTGDALTQEGWQVKLGQISLEDTTWTEGDTLSVLQRRIGLIEDWLENPTFPALDVGDTSNFGQTREILLNPVPPPDTNLHAHWTMNSFDVDGDGNLLIRDVSGRNNHALIRKTDLNGTPVAFPGMSSFPDHDPASDFINVSGNRSVLLNSIWTGAQLEFLILASNGASEHTKTYNGNQYPLNITQTTGDSGGYNKNTLVFWYKPTIGAYENAALVGQDRGSGLGGSWGLNFYKDGSTHSGMNANNDISINWNLENSGADSYLLTHDEANPLDGWYGANDTGTYTPVRNNEWHLFAIQTNHDDDYQELWIYREGEGLLYHKTRTLSGSTNASTPARGLYLNGDAYHNYTQTRNNTKGYYDEVRLYNSILTPRNIRYLYMNPTGRPRQLQPRPGLAVKKGYETFANVGSTAGSFTKNTFAYFHGFDVDGNPADVDPYISLNGNVKYLKKGHLHLGISTGPGGVFDGVGNSYYGNTGYIMYNDTAYTDQLDTAAADIYNSDNYYVMAIPVGANTTNPETWKRTSLWGRTAQKDIGWEYFIPDDDKDLIIGEIAIANSKIHYETNLGTSDFPENQLQIATVEPYQFARKASIVRESYNFTIKPSDFLGNFNNGNHFFANDTFWAEPNGLMNGVFISAATIGNAAILSLSASKIETGTIEAKVTVGGETKVLIDGVNSRIVISD